MSDSCTKRFVIKADPFLTKGEKGDRGADGADGSLSFPITTDNVTYRGDILTGILDTLTYLALKVLTFTANTLIYEKGTVLTSLFVSWTYNKDIESQSITGVGVTPPTLLAADRNKTLTLASVSIDTDLTLTADDVDGDATSPITKVLTISFLNKIYWGKAGIPGSINSAFLLTLTSELAATYTKSFSVTTISTEYIWFASPVAYGLPSFFSNGFSGGMDLADTISFTNASGHTEDYYVFRCANDNLGLTTIQVV